MRAEIKIERLEPKFAQMARLIKSIEKACDRTLAKAKKVRQAAFFYRECAIAWKLAVYETLKEYDELKIRDRIVRCKDEIRDVAHSYLAKEERLEERRAERQVRADIEEVKAMLYGGL